MMVRKPTVSIITTCYNYARYLRDLAYSIIRQTLAYEWILVDDCSEDNPFAVLEPVAQLAHLRYIRLTENKGYSVAKNVGIRAARGSYFCMIDADDMLTAGSLRCRMEALHREPDRLWVHGEALCIDENKGGRVSERYRQINDERRRRYVAEGMDLTKTYHHRLVHAQTVMVRRAFHERLGLYDERLRFSSDNEMWRRAIRFGVLPIHIDENVAVYRVHPNRMATSAYKKQRIKEVKRFIIDVVEQRYTEGITADNTPLLEAC